MTRFARRSSAAALAAVALSAVAGGGVAHAAGEQLATGDVVSGPFHLKFEAKRAAGTKSTQAVGTFDAEMKIGPATLMQLHGPVTCLDVRGTSIGLYYPIERSTPSAFSMIGAGVYIWVETDGKGHATRASFLPSPFGNPAGCRPVPGLLPASGSASTQGS